MGKNQVTLTFVGDDKELAKTFKQVGDSSDKMRRDVDQSARSFRTAGGAIDGWGSKLKTAALAGAAAFVAVGAAAVKFGSDSVKTFVEAETAQAKLEDAYQRFPKLAKTNISALQKLNSELAKKTRFDDDAAAEAQAVLAQYKLTGAQILKLTPLMQDYAARTGRDLPAAAAVLGKALLGKGKTLADVGIKFKDTGKLGDNFTQIVHGLRRQVGGFAEKEGQTSAGKLEILNNKFGELKETVGGILLPVFSVGVDKIGRFVDFGVSKFEDLAAEVDDFNMEEMRDLRKSLDTVASKIGGAVSGAFSDMKRFVRDNREEIRKFTRQLDGFTKDTGPILVFLVKSLAAQWRSSAKAIMATVDALDRVKSWYKQNIGWLAPFSRFFGVGGQVAHIKSSGAAPGNLPVRHSGGVMPGPPGTQGLAMLLAGERVLSPAASVSSSGGGRTVIELRSSGSQIDNFLLQLLQRAIKARGGNVQVVIGS